MKKEIVEEIRKELFKEDLYKKRKDFLVSRYIDVCRKIKDRIFSKEDMDFIKKNQKIIRMQEHISIPGSFYNYIEKKNLEGTFSVKVDFPYLGIIFPTGCFVWLENYFTGDFLMDEEKNLLREISKEIIDLGSEYSDRSYEICSSIPYGITVASLQKNFPEAYNIYVKLSRKNEKSKK